MKDIPFEKSILAQIGWSEQDYIDVVVNMANLKMTNNIPLTPNECWVYLNKEDLRNETRNNRKIKRVGKNTNYRKKQPNNICGCKGEKRWKN